MRRAPRQLLLCCLLLANGAFAQTEQPTTPQPSAAQLAALPKETAQLIERGRMVALAGDCAGCHTMPGGKPFAGNYVMQSPLGAIVSTNITPSKQHGIGDYSEADLARALREGKRKDGARLYPAMPYDSYTLMTDEDMHALHAYLQHGVPAVEQSAQVTQLPFPFNLRMSMLAWNALFLDAKRFTPDPKQSPEWNRGAYLTEALEHCAACHTPRNTLMAADKSRAFAGSQLGPWYAPNITSDPISGIGAWSVDELVQYLRTGRAEGKGQAAGGMAEAVENSLQFLPEADLRAMAVYLKTLPPIRDTEDANLSTAAHAHGTAYSDEPSLRGSRPQDSVEAVTSGRALFSAYCASCHQASGSGTPDQAYPSLFHNTATGLGRPDNLIAAMLFGVQRNAGGKEVLMPRFDEKSYVDPLTNEQIAAIANHVLQHYGPATTGTVSAADVQHARQGGPQPALARLQPFIAPTLGVVALLTVLVLWWLIGRRRRGYGGYRRYL
ncbi:cytochrome c [Diaphorobacter sp. HDW4A]|uniref:cytochrome c n=1 Tax=Diaphorobacter sp. HDW4A TaxID=2714924 RepID=UPI00140DC7B7|nr:cytochrome c [Diaphorobacter sp. HDW4A]QIL83502.1 cytochrome c [Diaphorobacter sp. HDW4A]